MNEAFGNKWNRGGEHGREQGGGAIRQWALHKWKHRGRARVEREGWPYNTKKNGPGDVVWDANAARKE